MIISRTHLIELLAEARNPEDILQEWKNMKHAYKLPDGNYLFSWSTYLFYKDVTPIDFDSIEEEAFALRLKLKASQLFLLRRLQDRAYYS